MHKYLLTVTTANKEIAKKINAGKLINYENLTIVNLCACLDAPICVHMHTYVHGRHRLMLFLRGILNFFTCVYFVRVCILVEKHSKVEHPYRAQGTMCVIVSIM